MDAVASAPASAAPPAPAASRSILWAKEEFSFHDVLDAINPLQHLPIIATIYRWVTGDTIGNLPRIIGDTLFGGPIGLATGVVSAAIKEFTGRDPGEHVVALLTDDPATAEPDPIETVAATTGMPVAAAASTTTAPATTAAPPPVAAIPDHAPIPLNRGTIVTLVRPEPAPAAAAATPAQQDFLAQRGAVERRFAPSATPRQAAVPLQLTAGLPGSVMAGPPVARNGEADFSRRMMEALDKYRSMQAMGAGPGRTAGGAVLDLSH